MDDADEAPWGGLVGARLDFLERLAEAPADKRTLEADLDCSRSTIDRAIRRLETADLVTRTAEGYRTTTVGRMAARQCRAHRSAQATLRAAREVFAPLPEDAAPDPAVLSDARVTTADAVDRLVSRLQDAGTCRVVLPSAPDARLLRLLHARVVRDGLDADVVTDDDAADRLRETFPSLTAGLLDAEHCDLRRGATPAYGLVVTDDAHVTVFTVADGAVAGAVETEAPGAVQWARETVADALAAGDPVPDPPATRTAVPTDLERGVTNAGLTVVDESYFADRTPAEPETAWRVGLDLTDVYYGYAIDRPADGGDGPATHTGEAGRSPSTDADRGDHAASRGEDAAEVLRGRLRSGDAVVLGPPGTGKSTLCRQVACRWVRAGRGPVFHRPARASGDLSAVVDHVRAADGEALVVVEDAADESVLGFLRAVGDDPDVTVLAEARERAWADTLAGLTDPRLRETADRLTEYRVPEVSLATCRRAIETFEATTGRSVPLSAETLLDRVRNEGGLGEMLVLSHRVVAHTSPTPWEPDPVGESALDADVRAAYQALAGADPPALSAGLLVATLSAVERPVSPGVVHALAVAPDGPSHEAVERAIDVLDGRVLVRESGDGRVRTHHPRWATRFLAHALDRAERETVRLFERATSALFALVADPDRRAAVEEWTGRAPTVEALADDGVDEVVRSVFALATEDSSLAPLFGTTEHSGIEVPAACSPATRLECRSCRGKAWYDAGDPERAETELAALCDRASEVSDEATRTEYLAEGHRGLAEVVVDRGATERAQDSLQRGLSAAREGDHPRRAVGLRTSLAWAAMTVDDYDEAERHLQAAREACEDLPPCGPCSDTLYYLAKLEHFRGDLAAAESWLAEAVELDRDLGHDQNRSSSLKLRADIARERGDRERAADLYRRSLELKRTVRDRPGEAHTLFDLGVLHLERTDHEAAERTLQRSLDIARANEMRRHVGRVQGALGRLALARDAPDRAAEHFGTQLSIHDDLDHARGVASATARLGDVARDRGQVETARDRYEDALDRFRDIEAHGEVFDVLERLVDLLEGRDDAAVREHCERGVELAEDLDRPRRRAAFARRLDDVEDVPLD